MTTEEAVLRGLLIALALLLSGCAEYYWTKAGATDDQFYKDSRECAIEASPLRSAGVVRVNDDGLYRACLYARGYRRDKYVLPPTPSWRGVTE